MSFSGLFVCPVVCAMLFPLEAVASNCKFFFEERVVHASCAHENDQGLSCHTTIRVTDGTTISRVEGGWTASINNGVLSVDGGCGADSASSSKIYLTRKVEL